MANRTNEDFFDIPSLTPKIPAELGRPWQKLNPTDEKAQHVSATSSHLAIQDNEHQNFNGAINDSNHDGRNMDNPESTLPIISGRSGTQITNTGTQNENLESWDPMGMDYACPTFNCYKRFNVLASEPPKQRQPQSPEKKCISEDISLYVANIPTQMTQEGLKNLFQGAGKVHSCCVLPPKDASQETKIGFVTFHSWNEASKAIECYDGFSLGSNMKLRVKVANRKGQRRGSTHVSNDDGHSSTEDVNGSDVYGEPCVNGFSGSDINSNTVPESRGVNSIKNEQATPKAVSNNTSSPGTPGEERPCTNCGKLSTQRCSACKAPYCSRDCQKADRVNHKVVCNYGNTKTSTPAASASQHSNQGPKTSTPTASASQQSKHGDPIDEIDFDCIDISMTNHATAAQVTADHMSNEGSVCRDSQSKNAARVSTPPVTTPLVSTAPVSTAPVSTPPSIVLSQLPPAPTLAYNTFRLLVTTVASGNSFWAQVVDDVFCRFYGVTQQMAETREESLERVTEPCQGIYCLVRFSLDGCWYRSRVEQWSDDKKVEVLFVDYGNKEWKEEHELYYLPSYFSEIPAQARLFTLSSVVVSQDAEVQKTMMTYLDGMVSGKTLNAEVVPAVVGCNPEVVLREDGSKQTMNEIVVEQQRGLESSLGVKPSPQTGEPLANLSQLSHLGSATMLPQSGGVPQEVVNTPPSTPSCESGFKTYMASDVPNEVLPLEKTFNIFVSDISSPSLFWIQLPDTAIDKLNHLCAQLDATYKESIFAEYVPSVGELVVAKFTDKLWYRAKVDCIYNNGTLKVTFVDFGNSEDVRLDDVRRITRCLVDIPKLAIRCCLIGVESPSKTGDWPAECMDMCKRLMFNKRCTATVEGHVRDIVMLRVMSSLEPNGATCDVNEELVTRGYAKSTKPDPAQGNVKQENGASRNPYNAESTKRFATKQLGGLAAPPENDSSRSVVSDNVQNAPQNIELNPQTTSAQNQKPTSAQNQKPTSSVAQAVAPSNSGTSQNVTNAGPKAPQPNLPFNQRFLPQPNIPSCAFDVVVNDIVSGDAFFAQMIDPALVRQLHKCVRDLNEFCKQSPLGAIGNVTIGSLGCARFSLDNVWYRAEVISTEETGYRVRFVDFGNSEVVAVDAFRDVPPSSFYDLAPQAISCRLATAMSGNVESWGEMSREMLVKLTRNKRLSCTVLNAHASPYPVKLEEHSGGETIDLAKKLQDSEFRLSKENTSRPRSKSSSSGNSWSRSEFGELVLGPALASSGIEGSGTEQELVVTDVIHPTYFWAQVALRSNIENLNRLTTDLNEHYNNASYSPFEAKVNTFCACKFTQDNIWYRAFLKGEHPTKGFIVHFVDFGNSELTTAERLRPLEEKFLTEPFRAILCAVASVEPVEGKFWGKEAIELFQGMVTGNVLKCIVVHKSVSRVFVDVQDPGSDDGQSLKTRLIESGVATESGSYLCSPKKKSSIDQDQLTATTVNDGQCLNESEATGGLAEQAFDRDPSLQNNPSCSSTQSDGGGSRTATLDNAPQYQPQIPLQNPKKIAPTSDNSPSGTRTASSEPARVMASQFPFVPVDTENHVRVIVNEVSSPREIYFQVVDADSVAALTALSESLNAQLRNTSQIYTPIPGELCCALFSVDSCWYRVSVRGVDLNAGLAAVHFLDYGNHDNVPFASLRPITPSLAELPFQARTAALAGVVADVTTWTQDRLDYLKTLLLEKLLMAKVAREVQGVLEMEFYDTSGEEDILINALFTEQGYADPQPPTQPPTVIQPQPPTVQSPHVPVIPEVTLTESELEVIVTEVNGPECFYVQNIVPVTIETFAAMTQEMNSFCENFHGVPPAVNIGETCCAKFACDGQWYRARVEAFPGNGLVRVFYVDFGNREDVDPAGLKPLVETFVSFPTQALQCTLANVQPVQEAWSPNAIEWLKSCILGKRLRARVVGRVDSLLQLELIDTSNPDQDVVINLKMVEMGEGRVA